MVDVISASGTYSGLNYGQLAARWWNWYLSIPKDINPAADSNGKDCAQYQDGPVWFLAGTPEGKNTANRTCNIPSGKAIFFPVVTNECSTKEGKGNSQQELSDCARLNIDEVSNKSISIDGQNLDLNSYRVQSPLFDLDFPEGNIYGQPTGITKSVADGFWILLAPPSPGTKITVKFKAMAHCRETCEDFVTDVTYSLTVQ